MIKLEALRVYMTVAEIGNIRDAADRLGRTPSAVSMALKQLEGEIDKTSFAWHGPTQPGSDFSYRIQGPTLIVEYACQDLGGDPLNHLHSMYRDPTNEYGKRLLD